jgi:hypothetical protein
MNDVSRQIVDAILQGDQEQFNSAFENAIATKISDALEVKKIEIASNLLDTSEEPAVEVETVTSGEETQEVETEQ